MEQVTYHSCWAIWSKGEYEEDCQECGAGSLEIMCLIYGGRCGSLWNRSILDSHDSGIGHWHGRCSLPPEDQAVIFAERSTSAMTNNKSNGFTSWLRRRFSRKANCNRMMPVDQVLFH